MRDLLVIKAGTAVPETRRTVGDYDRWFAEPLASCRVRAHVVQVELGERLPDARAVDGVLITGSPCSVTAWTDWMERTADLVRTARERRQPVLGVCFGHQLLARAFGGKVERSPGGREIGTVQVRLSAAGRADPLFAGLPERVAVQATHEDVVTALPAGATVLAANAACAVQALAVGEALRGVQFHPELSTAGMAALVLRRAAELEAEGVRKGARVGETVRALLSGVRPTPFGPRILTNFVTRFC